jgi:N utilization substance protein A
MMKLGMDEIQYIRLFESITSAPVKDCVVGEDEIIIVVDEGDMGLAIGRGGEKIEKIRRKVGKNVSVIEYSKDPEKFVRNLFAPVKLEEVRIDNGMAIVKVSNNSDGRRVVGRAGSRINRAKTLLDRHHDEITEVKIRRS